MDFIELAEKRYSCRQFSDKPVEKEKLSLILRAGKSAPTAKNNQPQLIYVLQSDEALNKINSLTQCVYGAKTVLMICYKKSLCWADAKGKDSGLTDTAIITTQMMLEAEQLGLGSCMVFRFDPDEVHKAFELDDDLVVAELLPIGYPDADSAPSERHFSRKDESETVIYL